MPDVLIITKDLRDEQYPEDRGDLYAVCCDQPL